MTNKEILIYDAVLEIIKEDGFNSNIKIADIAERANIGKGTVYEYFSNKNDLLERTALYVVNKNKEYILQEIDEQKGVVSLLNELIERILTINHNIFLMFAYKDLSNFLTKELQVRLDDELTLLNKEYYEYLIQIVNIGVNESIFSSSYTEFEVKAVIQTLTASCLEYVRETHKSQANHDPQSFVNDLVKVVTKILK